MKDGSQSIYLDCYRNGEHTYEYLNLYLIPKTSPRAKELNASALENANYIKAQRIMEITDSESGLKRTKLLSKLLLTDIMQEYSDSVKKLGTESYKNVDMVKKTLIQYRGSKITFSQVDKDFVVGYINFLKEEYRGKHDQPISYPTTTSNGYCNVFSGALNMAVRREYIAKNLFRKIAAINKIKRSESPRTYLVI